MTRRKKTRAPWGDLLGKPIERLMPRDDARHGENAEHDAIAIRYEKMCRLKADHYGIEGETGWRPWFELALALASELDDALTIVDPPPPPTGKTAPRWRGAEGLQLLNYIEFLREDGGGKVKQEALLAELQELSPQRYGKMSPAQLKKNYHEAKRHHQKSTKQKEN